MADVIYDRLSGLPPEQGSRLKDMGDGTFAPQAMSLSGLPPLQSLSAVSPVPVWYLTMKASETITTW
jgi:hypothetical protein